MQTMRDILNEELLKESKSERKHLNYLYLLDYIKQNNKISRVEIESNIRLEYVGDFYGLLRYINTSSRYNYVNMLLNNLSSSHEYDGMNQVLYIVDEADAPMRVITERLKNKISL